MMCYLKLSVGLLLTNLPRQAAEHSSLIKSDPGVHTVIQFSIPMYAKPAVRWRQNGLNFPTTWLQFFSVLIGVLCREAFLQTNAGYSNANAFLLKMQLVGSCVGD